LSKSNGKGALGFKRRAADGLLGQFAAAVVAAVAGSRISGRHDTFQFSPHYYSILEPSIFAEWGLNQANTRRGVFRVKISEPSGLRRPSMTHAHSLDAQVLGNRSRETTMKDATKKAASGALAQILAVTAMLVIASVVFYVR
jgi:hypothetical protein